MPDKGASGSFAPPTKEERDILYGRVKEKLSEISHTASYREMLAKQLALLEVNHLRDLRDFERAKQEHLARGDPLWLRQPPVTSEYDPKWFGEVQGMFISLEDGEELVSYAVKKEDGNIEVRPYRREEPGG